jgi:hypothetical protein
MVLVVRELKCLASRAISATSTPDSDMTETKCIAVPRGALASRPPFLVSVLTAPVGAGSAESAEVTVVAQPVPLEREEPQVSEPNAAAMEAEPAEAEPGTAEPEAEPAEAGTGTAEPEAESAEAEPETETAEVEPEATEPETEHAEPEPEKQAIPERVTAVSTGLLSVDWQQRVDSSVKVVLDSAFWRKTRKTLAEQSTELGAWR